MRRCSNFEEIWIELVQFWIWWREESSQKRNSFSLLLKYLRKGMTQFNFKILNTGNFFLTYFCHHPYENLNIPDMLLEIMQVKYFNSVWIWSDISPLPPISLHPRRQVMVTMLRQALPQEATGNMNRGDEDCRWSLSYTCSHCDIFACCGLCRDEIDYLLQWTCLVPWRKVLLTMCIFQICGYAT